MRACSLAAITLLVRCSRLLPSLEVVFWNIVSDGCARDRFKSAIDSSHLSLNKDMDPWRDAMALHQTNALKMLFHGRSMAP